MPAKLPLNWTAQPAALADTAGLRHFRLLGQQGRGAERAVRLQAVLDGDVRLLVPLRRLRDRSLWLPGWQQLPADDAVALDTASDLLEGDAWQRSGTTAS